MRILVLGGSPKGATSVTMQYVRWLAENMEGAEFETIQIASRIAALERDESAFASAVSAVGRADAVLWAFPLYVFTVCSQYKRFIELVHERGAEGAFQGKYAASLSTSIHFFDHTAHEYIREVSEDLGMSFAGCFSPKMDDLLNPTNRAQLLAFGRDLADATEKRLSLPRHSAVLPRSWKAPVLDEPAAQPAAATGSTMKGKRVLVLVDYPDRSIGPMARRFAADARGAGAEVELLGLADMGMKGGCMGCLKCGQANQCAWEGKDGFIESFRTKVLPADLLVVAGTIVDRAFSARWKAFLDRSFFNTHQRVLRGKQFLLLASGPLSHLDNFRQTMQAWVEWQGGNLIDMLSDEVGSSTELERIIDASAERAGAALASGTLRPATFLGVGGMKIFRDDIYDGLRIVFKGDHRSYKADGSYDFPTRKPLRMLAIRLGYWITSIPFIYRGMMRDFPAQMIKPYARLFRSSGRADS
ncbi:MAG TPA: NAD(P)H-dependent oxidoreductase [Rectinemataceae bacterium]|nr:NAD(P)H-dependent oxidoreductase [Rectinemataceae bacterium]